MTDVPGPPINVEVTDWDKNRVDLVWQKPLKDGGSPITNYLVECKEKFSTSWKECHLTMEPLCQASVTDVIQEGKSYEFRVKAVNKAGQGPPSEPTKQVRVACWCLLCAESLIF